MRKTEYIGTEFSRFGADRVTVDPLRSAIKRKLENGASYRDRDSQIAGINRTFDDVMTPVALIPITHLPTSINQSPIQTKVPAKQHYSKKGVHAVDEMPILPDFEASYWGG